MKAVVFLFLNAIALFNLAFWTWHWDWSIGVGFVVAGIIVSIACVFEFALPKTK